MKKNQTFLIVGLPPFCLILSLTLEVSSKDWKSFCRCPPKLFSFFFLLFWHFYLHNMLRFTITTYTTNKLEKLCEIMLNLYYYMTHEKEYVLEWIHFESYCGHYIWNNMLATFLCSKEITIQCMLFFDEFC